MIDGIFRFLKEQLTGFLNGEAAEAPVVDYVDISTDPPKFPGKINMALVNMEEESQLRDPNPYVRNNGSKMNAKPAVRLFLHILFAGKAGASKSLIPPYEEVLGYISKVILFFQANPVFDSKEFPYLAQIGVERLIMELHPLTYTQQNELWSALKTAYLPSVCYRAKMLVIQEEPAVMEGEILEQTLSIRQL